MAQMMKHINALAQYYPVKIREQHEHYIVASTFFFGIEEEHAPFRGQMMEVQITVTKDFPQKSPSVGVAPGAIYHPNIDINSGSVCVTALNTQWTNAYTLKDVVELILPSLLNDPNPKDPLNLEAASLSTYDCRCKAHIIVNDPKFKREWYHVEQLGVKIPQYFKDRYQSHVVNVKDRNQIQSTRDVPKMQFAPANDDDAP